MDHIDLLAPGLAWTGARIAAASASDLGTPTPCGMWDLRQLLDHLVDTSGAFADALGAGAADGREPVAPTGPQPWSGAFADVAARTLQGWARPGTLDRTYELRFGTMPGPVMASANLLEVVVHGWDVGQATGEAVPIPDDLAVPILAFAREAIGEDQRGEGFAADLGVGDTPAEQLVAFLGRKPR